MNCPHCQKPIPLTAAEIGRFGGMKGTGIAKRRSDSHYMKMREKADTKRAKAKAFRKTLGLAT